MNRNNLIDQLAESTGRTNKETEETVDALLTHIVEALVSGDKVDLRGFGTFQVNEKKERQGRNPRTGETLTIAAKRVADFRPGKELAERVNRKASVGSDSSAS
jgi:DNA-binding protein HU-beta